MPTPKPLTPMQARRTIAHRLATRIDRVRQIRTRVGLAPYQVFRVWSRYGGQSVGEGHEKILQRTEFLPTPKIDDLTAMSYSLVSTGVMPVGTLRVTRISATLTLDMLKGRKGGPVGWEGRPNEDYYFEVAEDGRGDDPAERNIYRIAAEPSRQAGKIGWMMLLSRDATDNNRNGTSSYQTDVETGD